MHVAARMTTKGQLTVPKSVREALDIGPGDDVVFRVEGRRAIMSKTPDLLDLGGVVRVAADRRNATWDDVLRRIEADR